MNINNVFTVTLYLVTWKHIIHTVRTMITHDYYLYSKDLCIIIKNISNKLLESNEHFNKNHMTVLYVVTPQHQTLIPIKRMLC